jgi:hypothetical protein
MVHLFWNSYFSSGFGSLGDDGDYGSRLLGNCADPLFRRCIIGVASQLKELVNYYFPIRGPFTALGRVSGIRPGILCRVKRGYTTYYYVYFELRAVYGPSRSKGFSRVDLGRILELSSRLEKC